MIGYCLLCEKEIVPVVTWTSLFMAEKKVLICPLCEKKFQKIEGGSCGICGKQSEVETCHDCLRWNEEVEWMGALKKNISLYAYNDWMKEMMARWKFRGDIVLIQIFQEQIREAWEQVAQEVNLIVPIPLSEERFYERGFNQAEEIAKLLPYPYEEHLIRIHSEKQSKKNRLERITGENVFRFKQGGEVIGKNILLVDDIYTTGTTIRHAASTLKNHGAKDIFSFTIAR